MLAAHDEFHSVMHFECWVSSFKSESFRFDLHLLNLEVAMFEWSFLVEYIVWTLLDFSLGENP